MAVTFKELAGSPKETYALSGFTAQREILVAWEDRDAMVRELLGDTRSFAGTALSQYPTKRDVVVSNINVEPWTTKVPDDAAFTDIASELNAYSGQLAKFDISYAWLPPASLPGGGTIDGIEPETFITYSRTIGGEYAKQGGHALVWKSDPQGAPPNVDAVPTVRIPITEHHITWHRVNNPPQTRITDLIGRVNDVEFFGYAAETLLFEGASMEREFQGFPENDPVAGGEGSWTTWKVDYTFREKKITGQAVVDDAVEVRRGDFAGWNHTWRSTRDPQPAGYDRLVPYFDNDKGIYATGGFSSLFLYE